MTVHNSRECRSSVSRKSTKKKSNYVGGADRNISHAVLSVLLCQGEGCGASKGCSARQAPAKKGKKKERSRWKKKKGRKAKNGAG